MVQISQVMLLLNTFALKELLYAEFHSIINLEGNGFEVPEFLP